MFDYNEDLILALHADEEAMDFAESEQDSTILDYIMGEETDLLLGVSQSNSDLLNESQSVKVFSDPHDKVQVWSWNARIEEEVSDRKPKGPESQTQDL